MGLPFVSDIPVVGGAANQFASGFGLGPAPNAWDAEKNTKPVLSNAQGIYDAAAAAAVAAGRNGPALTKIQAQQVAAPAAIQAQQIGAPTAITANNVGVSDLVGGQQAADLRAQQLQQAEVAANSPSSAAAQMRAAGAQIQGQQAAMAAQARGPNRAAARRDAMLATGNLGMQAANQTAALAAQENAAKQQAYSQTLAGVRAGDVSGANSLANVGVANQQAGLQAQTVSNAQALAAAQANQTAGLTAGQVNAANQLAAAQGNQTANLQGQIAQGNQSINAWTGQQGAVANYMGAATGAVGQQNNANATWAGYAAKQNEAQQKQNAALTSSVTSALGMSDSRSKEDVAPIGAPPAALPPIPAAFKPRPALGGTPDAVPAGNSSPWGAPPAHRSWDDMTAASSPPPPQFGRMFGGLMGQPSGAPAPTSPWTSDEETKRAVAQMGTDDLIDWADKTDLATYRYKPGIGDGGASPQVGVSSAQRLERTGPLGKLMVSEGEDGLKRVDYPKLAYAVGKAALAKADKNQDLYERLARDVQVANQRNNRSRGA